MIEKYLGELTLTLLFVYALAYVKERTSIPQRLRSAWTHLKSLV
jgi:hypothetical protein